MGYLIATKREAEDILNAKDGEFSISLDLGISKTRIRIKGRIAVIDGQEIPIDDFKKINEKFCYLIEDNQLKKLAFFSEETSTYYKLIPTDDWPTIALSSTPMHRHTHLSPKQDTMLKIREIEPVKGKVLDTCMGLGYTAIMSSKKADEVHTFEKDRNMVLMSKINPHSREIFTAKNIVIHDKDVFEGIKAFNDSYFDRIIHDPPTFKRAPELYSGKFYAELCRVLKSNGIMYHYSPMPSKTKGKKFYTAIIRNLREAGFSKAEYREESSGIRAVKV